MASEKITIDAVIAAGQEKVWEYWTKPEHIRNWNFAADSWQCPDARNDLRVSGTYFARMEAKDGSFGFDFEAVYDEVEENTKLTYTMGDGRQSTTTFEDQGNGLTKVTTVFDAESQNDPEMQKAGWQAILNNFKHYTEAN